MKASKDDSEICDLLRETHFQDIDHSFLTKSSSECGFQNCTKAEDHCNEIVEHVGEVDEILKLMKNGMKKPK